MNPTHPDSMSELETRLAELSDCSWTRQEPLAPHTTLRIGGPAQLLVRVRTEEALIQLLAAARLLHTPLHLLGLGSNVLLPDEGVPGVVVLLEGEFQDCLFRDVTVEAGAGLPLARVAQLAVEKGLAGLEALAGFPSTVGGAVVMNAGCYGVEIKDVLVDATVVDPDGSREVLTPEDLQAGYRSTRLQGTSTVVLRARFRLQRDDPEAARARWLELARKRRDSMPGGRPNAGSVFKNPAGDHAGRLIDVCGLKGTRRGGAEISTEHANVIVNTGDATAADVLELMGIMRQSVEDRFAVCLQPELILLGDLGARWKAMLREQEP